MCISEFVTMYVCVCERERTVCVDAAAATVAEQVCVCVCVCVCVHVCVIQICERLADFKTGGEVGLDFESNLT